MKKARNTKKARATAKAVKQRKLLEAASAKDEDERKRDSPSDNSEDTSG
jgi:hypothetical protein